MQDNSSNKYQSVSDSPNKIPTLTIKSPEFISLETKLENIKVTLGMVSNITINLVKELFEHFEGRLTTIVNQKFSDIDDGINKRFDILEKNASSSDIVMKATLDAITEQISQFNQNPQPKRQDELSSTLQSNQYSS